MSNWDKGGGSKSLIYGYNSNIDDEKEILVNGNGEPIIQNFIHYYCLQGEMYYAIDYQETLTAGQSNYYLIETGEKENHHMDAILNTDGDKFLIEYFINGDYTSSDTDILVRSFDYTTNDNNTCTLTSSPTVNTEGNLTDINYIGGGTGVGDTTSGGSASVGNFVYKLPTNSQILIKITNKGNNDAGYLFKEVWHEV